MLLGFYTFNVDLFFFTSHNLSADTLVRSPCDLWRPLLGGADPRLGTTVLEHSGAAAGDLELYVYPLVPKPVPDSGLENPHYQSLLVEGPETSKNPTQSLIHDIIQAHTQILYII